MQKQSFAGHPLRVKLDARDISGADKKWEWIKKGAPLLLEIGPRDVEGGKVCVTRRDQMAQGKRFPRAMNLLPGSPPNSPPSRKACSIKRWPSRKRER